MPYGAGPGQPGAVGGALTPQDERTWTMLAHLSGLVGFLGPLLIMLLQGPKSSVVRANAVESLNFQISMLIYMIASIVLSWTVILFFAPFVVMLAWLALLIMATVKSSNGESYRYPLTIRLVS